MQLMPLVGSSTRVAGLSSPSDAMALHGGASVNPMSSDKISAESKYNTLQSNQGKKYGTLLSKHDLFNLDSYAIDTEAKGLLDS